MKNFKPVTTGFRYGLLAISALVVILDQLSKYVIRNNFDLYEMKNFIPGWNWILIYNEGSAFGFLDKQGGWQQFMFGGIAIIVAVALVYYLLWKSYHWLAGLGFSFILGGALGNLIDRIADGRVTDFIDWYAGTYHWPAFNLADSFITVGVALLIIEGIFVSKK